MPSSNEGEAERERVIQLHQILVARFDEEELRTLCFDLGVDYDDLPAHGKASKARELVRHVERRGQTLELVRTGKRIRPDISWEGISEVPSTPPREDTPHHEASKLTEEERQSIERQIAILRRNLAHLEEQIARFGMVPPLHLLNERDYARAQIAELEQQLAAVGS